MEEYPELIYSDSDILVISKPQGISFHQEGKKEGIIQILRRMEELKLIPEGERIYPVHRLDRITSGILLFARGRNNANKISNEFRHNRAQKIYIALSDKKPIKKMGRIAGDMEKGRNGSYRLLRSMKQPAVTCFKSFSLSSQRQSLRMYVIYPKTGKTHQIRAALKSNSSPILGDGQYGRFDEARKEKRAYLHASALRFSLDKKEYYFTDRPSEGEFDAPEFQKLFETLFTKQNPFDLDWKGCRKNDSKEAHGS